MNLGGVFRQLDHAASATIGKWAWLRLPRGAVIAVRVRADLDRRRELRIARRAETAGPAWEREVAVFLRSFGVESLDGARPCTTPNQWYRHGSSHENGVVEALFLELRPGECRPGRALCWPCWVLRQKTEIPWFAAGDAVGQRCHTHALEAGRASLGALTIPPRNAE